MVASLLSLRLALLRNEVARTRAQRWAAAVLAAALVVATVGGVVAVVTVPVDALARPGDGVVLGAGLVVGWALTPLLALGGDGGLTAATLRAYPVPRRDQAVGLAAAALVGLPGAASVALTVVTVVAWSARPALLAPAALAGVVTLVAAAVAHRCVLDGLALVAASRRAREVVGGVVLVAAVLALPAWLLLVGRRAPTEVLRSADAVDVAGWVPGGAPWAAVAALARGDGAGAGAHAAVAAAWLLVTAAIWWRVLGRLAAPAPARGRRRRDRRLGAFAWTSDTVRGAVAARTLTSWLRDPRYSQNLVFALLLPVMGLAVDVAAGVPGPALVTVVVAVLLVTGAGALDLSHDSTAFAAHLSAGVRGRDDRAGRLLAHAAATLPVLVVGLLVAAVGLPASVLPGVLGVLVAVAGGALAAGAVSSTFVTVPTPPPGTSGARAGSGAPTALLYGVASGAAVLLAAVPAALTVVAGVTDRPGWAVAGLVVGAVGAAAAALVGVHVGGRILDRRGRRLYAALVRHA